MSSSARGRIAERVKNAYAAGYNDGRKGLDRMDEVAETETAKILEAVRGDPGNDMTLAYMAGREEREADGVDEIPYVAFRAGRRKGGDGDGGER